MLMRLTEDLTRNETSRPMGRRLSRIIYIYYIYLYIKELYLEYIYLYVYIEREIKR
jgi:hypothetical protein